MKEQSNLATAIAVIIGLICATSIWLIQPVNNFLYNNSRIADHYLPELGVTLVIIITLIINPFLKWKLPKLSLNISQLSIIFGIILVACTSASYMSSLPHTIAKITEEASRNKTLAKIHESMDLPESLYVEPINLDGETPISSQLLDELDEGKSIPWKAWTTPLYAWGPMLAFSLLIMIGLAMIVFPQWRDNERLQFPLITVHQSLVECAPESKFPIIFKSGLFWFSVICVLIVYMCIGLNHHTGGNFPTFKLSWSLYDSFSGMFGSIHYYIKQGSISFIIIGITYFMPNRISFSLWFCVIAYSTYRMLGFTFSSPFYGDLAVGDHRNGATISVALVLLWLGRSQWLKVIQSMLKSSKDDTDRRNRFAGYVFLIGCLGLVGWQIWAGNTLGFAFLALLITIISTLVLARIVAEAGIPFLTSAFGVKEILTMFPISWLSAKAIYLTSFMDIIISAGSRVSGAVTSMHVLGMNKDNGPKEQIKLAKIIFFVMIIGIVVVGIVHLSIAYHNPGSLDGKVSPIQGKNLSTFSAELLNFDRGNWANPVHNRIGHTIFGFIFALFLQIACLISPLWPFHPIGILLADTSFIKIAWPSIFVGWSVRRLILAYGGAQVYRQAKPVFLGLIVGHILAGIIWAIVPAVLIAMGGDAAEIGKIYVTPHF